jgi:2-polyprenyl-6-methoxyphenol hydroxylase-like FAD-dependent oxidoreductase
MATRRALIIGGSVGGLFAAHMLGRIGWEVDVFERADEDLAGRGAGIGTHPALREVMRRLGLAIDDLCVATDGTYVCWDNADRLIHEVRQQRMMSAWAPIYRALRDSLRGPRYHRGMECIGVRSEACSATTVIVALSVSLPKSMYWYSICNDQGPASVRSTPPPMVQPIRSCWRVAVAEV